MIGPRNDGQVENFEGFVMVVKCQAHLLELVFALRYIGGFPDFLHCRHQERDQDSDYGDHHQELDQGESRTFYRLLHTKLRASRSFNPVRFAGTTGTMRSL
jgi:hypothetical protein